MGGKKTKIDLVQLAKELPELNNRKDLYHVLKAGLEQIGHWRQHERGNPKKGYQAMLENKGKNLNN